MFEKTCSESTTDQGLLEEFKYQNCVIDWITPPTSTHVIPPKKTTKAVIVDVRNKGDKGAIRVFRDGQNDRIGTVGTTDKGPMMVVPWEDGWWYRAIGSPKVGYVIEDGTSEET